MEELVMKECTFISRKDALNALKAFGINGNQVYFIDFLPLIEMVWADGHAQESELVIVENHIKTHVDQVNTLAGCKVVSADDARTFINRFITERPDPELMKTLRQFVKPVRLTSADKKENDRLRSSLLDLCMDIASSSVTEYPYNWNERFHPDEKRCFFSILESL
jgi:hypothetical protein